MTIHTQRGHLVTVSSCCSSFFGQISMSITIEGIYIPLITTLVNTSKLHFHLPCYAMLCYAMLSYAQLRYTHSKIHHAPLNLRGAEAGFELLANKQNINKILTQLATSFLNSPSSSAENTSIKRLSFTHSFTFNQQNSANMTKTT